MAGTLSLTIGANTYSVPISGTNAQINAAILRYAMQKGIPTEGRTAADIANDVLLSVKKYIRDNSVDRQRIELLAAQQATIEAAIAAENPL